MVIRWYGSKYKVIYFSDALKSEYFFSVPLVGRYLYKSLHLHNFVEKNPQFFFGQRIIIQAQKFYRYLQKYRQLTIIISTTFPH